MNRRDFFVQGGSGAALVATGGLGFATRLASAQQGSSSVYSSSATAHAIACGNVLTGTSTPNNWTAVGASLAAVHADWTANGYDAKLRPGYAQIAPGMVRSSNLNQQQILQQVRIFSPSVTLPQLQSVWASQIDSASPSQVQTVINALCNPSQGMASYVATLQTLAAKMAVTNPNQTMANIRPWEPQFNFNGPQPTNPIPPDGGKNSGYNCAADGMASFFAGLAFAVLAVMSFGTSAVLAGAAWGAIAFWGGTGAAAWGTGHVMACGF